MVLWVAVKWLTLSSSLSLLLLLLVVLGQCHAYRFADHVPSQDDQNEYNKDKAAAAGRRGGVTLLADLPPPTSTLFCFQTSWQRTDELLSLLWDDNVGYSLSSQDRNDESIDDHTHHKIRHNHELTYGEVTVLGGRQLAYEMGIGTTAGTMAAGPNDDDDDDEDDNGATKKNDVVIFYDLGSGVGRLVAQMYLDQPWRVQKSIGIELSLERHEFALDALTGLQQQHRSLGELSPEVAEAVVDESSSLPSSCDSTVDTLRRNENNDDDKDDSPQSSLLLVQSIEFHHGNVLEVDWWSDDATHIFLSSLCFPEEVLDALQQTILCMSPEDLDHIDDDDDDEEEEESCPSSRRSRSVRPQERERKRVPHQLQVVASLNRLQLLYESEEWDEGTSHIQMSWGPGTVKIYRRKKFTPSHDGF